MEDKIGAWKKNKESSQLDMGSACYTTMLKPAAAIPMSITLLV
jgi:hypothetical protein